MAREGYLLHAGEDTIHDPEAEKNAEKSVKTPHGKWENFWYYHKLHVIIAIAILAIAGYSIWTACKTVQPDYTIGMITQQSYPQEVIDTLQNEMEKYGKDLNNDGKVIVQINQYPIAANTASSGTSSAQTADPQMQMAYQTKMQGDVSTGTSIIFITDDESFRSQEKLGNHMFAYLDGSTPKNSATDYDKMRVSITKCQKLANLKVNFKLASGSQNVTVSQIAKNLSISLRIYRGSGIDGKEKDYYAASKALFDKLTT